MKEEDVPVRLYVYRIDNKPVEVTVHSNLEWAIIHLRMFYRYNELGFHIIEKLSNENR